MAKSGWLLVFITIAAAVLVFQSQDPTGASWPVLFLFFFGVALMIRALWRIAALAAATRHPRRRTATAKPGQHHAEEGRRRLTWSHLHV